MLQQKTGNKKKNLRAEEGRSPLLCKEHQICLFIERYTHISLNKLVLLHEKYIPGVFYFPCPRKKNNPTQKDVISIEQIRLIQKITEQRPEHGFHIIIIEDIDRLTIQANNALLKTFEDIPPATFFFVTTSNFYSLPETLQSRIMVSSKTTGKKGKKYEKGIHDIQEKKYKKKEINKKQGYETKKNTHEYEQVESMLKAYFLGNKTRMLTFLFQAQFSREQAQEICIIAFRLLIQSSFSPPTNFLAHLTQALEELKNTHQHQKYILDQVFCSLEPKTVHKK